MYVNSSIVLQNLTSSVVSSWYQDVFYNKADPRVRDKWLMGDPLPILSFYLFYIILIIYLLPKFMRNRKPYDVEVPSIILNIIIFFVNVYFVIVGSVNWFPIFNFNCQPMDVTESRIGLLGVKVAYYFLLSKFIYIFESIVLEFQKNYSYRKTYLLIHHATFPIFVWIIVNYVPSGHALFSGYVNSLQHMLLFGYRLVFVEIWPNLSRTMFNIKKPIGIILSILQFLVIFVHSAQLLFWNDCGFPIFYAYAIMVYATLITILLVTLAVPQM